MNDALLQSAWRMHQAGKIPEAARLYADILRANPRHFDALYQLGMIYLDNRRFADAEHLFAVAVQVNPQSAELFYNRGCALQKLGRPADALAAFARALSIKPDFTEARNNRGVVLLSLKRYREALACFDKVEAEKPGLAMVQSNRAGALLGLGERELALAASELALRLDPNAADAYFNRGAALALLGRREEALSCFDKALSINPNYVDAVAYRGIVLAMLDRHEEAIASYNKGLGLRPGDIDILYNRSTSLWVLKRFEEALPDLQQVLRADPQFKYARGNLLHCRMQLGDWQNLAEEKAQIAKDLQAGLRVLRPLQNAAICDSPEDLRQSARIWVQHESPQAAKPVWRGERYKHDRIRLAYISADFRYHPVSVLMAGVFERHDKSRFETIAISTGPDDKSGMRERLKPAFDRFIDVRNRSDEEVAKLLRDMEIDIAVDLVGFTENAFTAVLARRPVGLQVNYLGYPGTLGAPYIDYIIADRTVIPESQQAYYDEKAVYLPDAYIPNDSTRLIAERVPERREAGLPDEGFVFCCFNNLYKINPEMFALWMRVLAAVEGSVLWLSQATATAMRNFRREAEARGVAGDRLIFASFVAAPEEHLARLSLADLLLDTLPYNAHATTCDALWAGVPVLTMLGQSFAGRVGASLLSAIGLQEMIAQDKSEYETLALRLAGDRAAHAAIKEKLARNRRTHPLFDTARFTRNLEAAYRMMWERHQNGEQPASFAVPPVT